MDGQKKARLARLFLDVFESSFTDFFTSLIKCFFGLVLAFLGKLTLVNTESEDVDENAFSLLSKAKFR